MWSLSTGSQFTLCSRPLYPIKFIELKNYLILHSNHQQGMSVRPTEHWGKTRRMKETSPPVRLCTTELIRALVRNDDLRSHAPHELLFSRLLNNFFSKTPLTKQPLRSDNDPTLLCFHARWSFKSWSRRLKPSAVFRFRGPCKRRNHFILWFLMLWAAVVCSTLFSGPLWVKSLHTCDRSYARSRDAFAGSWRL